LSLQILGKKKLTLSKNLKKTAVVSIARYVTLTVMLVSRVRWSCWWH